jgi:hypothetical protein
MTRVDPKTLLIIILGLISVFGVVYMVQNELIKWKNELYNKGVLDGQLIYQNAIINQLAQTGQLVISFQGNNSTQTIVLRPVNLLPPANNETKR